MKKIIIVITSLIILISCEKQKNQQDVVKQNAEEYIKSKMDDPDSYEFAELELLDSVLYIDNIKSRKETFNSHINYAKERLSDQKRYKEELPSMYSKKDIEEYKNEINKNKKIIAAIDSIKKELGNKINDVAAYRYYFKFRGNNKLGAKVKNEFIVLTKPRPNFEILQMTSKKKKMNLTPNEFPGYKKILNKYN